jgi:hypothetical protein
MKTIHSAIFTVATVLVFGSTGLSLELKVNFQPAEQTPPPPPPDTTPVDKGDLLAVVKRYADVMISRGRDTYGTSTPLFASALNRSTCRLIPNDATFPVGIRDQDISRRGENVQHNENLYRLLYGLTDATGGTGYATEADKSLTHFLAKHQKSCGLFYWGEHMHVDFNSDKGAKGYNYTHEIFRAWDLFGQCYRLNAGAMNAFAKEGLWDSQIYKHTGYFSRHAYNCEAAGEHSNFPRHAGFYIEHWAEAYRRTRDQVYITAIEKVVPIYDGEMRNKTTNGIRAGRKDNYLTTVWVYSEASLAVSLGKAMPLVPTSTAAMMKTLGDHIDDHVTTLPHQPSGKGFISDCSWSNDNVKAWSDDWRLDYGGELVSAGFACLLYERYLQTNSSKYRDLVVKSADGYLGKNPSTAELWPGALAQVIFGQLNAYSITSDTKYLNRAHHFANWAIEKFLDGGSGLPRASTKVDHYEAITRGDSLMLALLELSLADRGTPRHFELVDR